MTLFSDLVTRVVAYVYDFDDCAHIAVIAADTFVPAPAAIPTIRVFTAAVAGRRLRTLLPR